VAAAAAGGAAAGRAPGAGRGSTKQVRTPE
jgi:hypothetical protein